MIPGAAGTAGAMFRAKGGAMAEQDDVRAWLARLEEARAAISAPISGIPSLAQDGEYPTDVNAVHRDGGASAFAECYGEDSAALIVAAVNALPALTAVVRAVLDLADRHDRCCGHVRAEELRAVVEGAVQR